MDKEQATSKDDKSLISTRSMDFLTGVFFLIIGGLVMYDSIRIGNSWTPMGPESGYFPFYISILLLFGAAGTILTALFAKSSKASGDEAFVRRGQFRSVMLVFFPTALYVVLMGYIGLYVSAALFIIGFMMINGKIPFIKTLPYAILTPLAIWFMFEVWFLVPLPKGPVENMLGF